MKKLFMLFWIGVVLINNSQAQGFDGIIIFEKDTQYVAFEIPFAYLTDEPNYEKLQSKVKYYDKAGKKMTLRPHQAKEFQFNYKNQKVRMVSLNGSKMLGSAPISDSEIFLKLEVDGYLKMFSFYTNQGVPGTYNTTTDRMTTGFTYIDGDYILKKGEGKLFRPSASNFKKDMAEYFVDCPTLVEKIKDRELKRHDVEYMVHYYNGECERLW